jgi:hypothetical protein
MVANLRASLLLDGQPITSQINQFGAIGSFFYFTVSKGALSTSLLQVRAFASFRTLVFLK